MSIYKSHTHGPIPLSHEGKRLMHTLRIAIQEAIQKGDYNQTNAVAHARGELAKYMSALEGQTSPDPAYRQKPAMSATEVNIMRQKKIEGAFKSWFDRPFSGYGRLRADMRKDADALLYDKVSGTTTGRWRSGGLKENLIQGARANLVMIDDPQNEQELDMSKKAVATRKRAAKAQAKMQLAGVRFIHGPKLDTIYTYKAKRTAKLHLGQEVVVRNQHGTSVGIVVQLDQPMPLGYTMETVVELTDKVAAI